MNVLRGALPTHLHNRVPRSLVRVLQPRRPRSAVAAVAAALPPALRQQAVQQRACARLRQRSAQRTEVRRVFPLRGEHEGHRRALGGAWGEVGGAQEPTK